ncbi:CPBP family intramembrane glutamic endopeptidase [Domibacillus epiphyticus]|uniref:CAAX protease family protein n=1 Tax=Domibacillus epiphyticus TaxID=1714355 RepID=A0A1V2AAG1_9BACI|nr:CPBP family intramembrane glutamic endopeptidase [Domibacillus epiphyticus]OMP67989.1 CAAX protease family protein [Domibacillus epiphyticus]
MRKEYGLVLITYILMQFSGFLGIPLLYKIGVSSDLEPNRAEVVAAGYWTVISFALATVIILFILKKSTYTNKIESQTPMSVGKSIFWSIAGVFLAYFSQTIAISIETALGIEQGSENTQSIIQLIEWVPLTMISVAVFGPILEEIVFRKILFGSLYERMPFFFAALVSAFVFSVAHAELEHILLYAAMGFTFAFLYVKTKRLIVPIVAHVAMNSFVVIVQYVFKDELDKMMKEAEQMQQFIAWLL